ncbi:MAG: MFS transporter, partial [Actinobacteria bacterium]|nr:MFS transporter [Actinomycetota bacterium]
QTGIYGYFMGGFGPAIPLLQADQGTTGAIAGLHGTALGLASLVAGVLNSRVVHRFGRYRSAWIGISIFLFGAFFFVTLARPAQTISAIFFAGIGMTMAISNTITYLSGHYGEQSPQALSQNNGITSLFNLFGTITIGLLATTAVSWRLGLLACFPFAAILYLTMGRSHSPEHIPDVDGHQRGPLPRLYWFAWIGLLFAISTEFAIIFWSAALIRVRTGIDPALATTLMLAFPLGMFLGRWFGAYVAPTKSVDFRLKLFLILQLVGFLLLWNSNTPILALASLLLSGLGTSMQFILSTARLLRFSAGKDDLGMGVASLAAGLAIAGSPFFLGALADQVGIATAFLVVPFFIAIAFAIVFTVPIKRAPERVG